VHALSNFFLQLVEHAGYGGLFVALTLANIGAPIGSELVLPAAGAMAAKGLLSSVWIATLVAVLGELTGQSIAYAIGRFGGRPVVERYGKYVRFHHAQMEQVESFFTRYGAFAIFLCRFIPVIRGIVGIPAGIAQMPLAPFYLWTLCGSALFCGGLILLGNALGAHAREVVDAIRHYAVPIVVLAIAGAAIFMYVRSRRARTSQA
jgi:membrane protein DedA with SNARE-associated domain